MAAYVPHSEEKSEKSVIGVIVHSFFVIPFLIAVFSVLLFAGVRILTMEQKTAYDLLNDVKIGSLTKRWQSAFELSKILANPAFNLKEERFDAELISAFEQSQHDDDRVRQYLALAMGRSGKDKFVDVLLSALQKEKEENLYALIYALGILKSPKAVAGISGYLEHPNPQVRLVVAMALGNIEDPAAVPLLKKTLNDSEPNVQWDTAISLAKLGDDSGRAILLNLLNRNYLAKFPEVDLEEQTHVLLVTIEAAGRLDDPNLNQAIATLAQSDQNMNVRKLAMEISQGSSKKVESSKERVESNTWKGD